jgi:ribokinase
MPEIVVIGSLNMDLAVNVAKMPAVGETLHGSDFHMIAGGKGANQAIAAARLGCSVAMVGCVGTDVFGQAILEGLTADGVDIACVHGKPEAQTGVALVTVEGSGGNSIIVVGGANLLCASDNVEAARNLIEQAKIIMLQLEIPLETVMYAANLAKEMGKTVILDPAPAQPLPASLLKSVDFLTPNETEAEKLSGRKITDVKSARLAAAELLGKGARAVVIKLGSQGLLWAEGNTMEHIEGYRVEAVDSTAAGDAFNAGLAVGLAEGRHFAEALKMANAAGALTATRLGARTSLPPRTEVDCLLGERL